MVHSSGSVLTGPSLTSEGEVGRSASPWPALHLWTDKTRSENPVMQLTFDSPTPPSPAPPTSVHPLESTVDRPHALASAPDDCLAYSFRHSSWAPTRRRVYAALALLAPSPQVTHERLDRFVSCGRRAWVMQHKADPARFKFAIDCCHDRFCVPCGRHRATVISENLARRLDNGRYRFLTLTLRSSDTPLARQLDRLIKGFRKLRQRSFWKERVTGGAAFFEVKWMPETRRWHPHLHILLGGNFVPQHMIKAAWFEITGDSKIVDIREVKRRADVIWYCCKYSTKPLHHSVVRKPQQLRIAINALADRKLINPFGTWVKWALLKPPPDDNWHLYAHLNEAIRCIKTDLHTARQLENAWSAFAAGIGPADFTIDRPPSTDDP